jgi:hypothetical protein
MSNFNNPLDATASHVLDRTANSSASLNMFLDKSARRQSLSSVSRAKTGVLLPQLRDTTPSSIKVSWGSRKTNAGTQNSSRRLHKNSATGMTKREESRVNAAVTLQRWWRKLYLRGHIFLVAQKAREWAEKEKLERAFAVRTAKVTLSKFFVKAVERLRMRAAKARKERRLAAALMVHRLLLARQSENVVGRLTVFRMSYAVRKILAAWRGSKSFERVRARLQNEELLRLLEQESLIERREIERQAQGEWLLVSGEIRQSEMVNNSPARQERFTDTVRHIQFVEREFQDELTEEFLYGAKGSSSIATIQRQLSPSGRSSGTSIGLGAKNSRAGLQGSKSFLSSGSNPSFSQSQALSKMQHRNSFGSVRVVSIQRGTSTSPRDKTGVKFSVNPEAERLSVLVPTRAQGSSPPSEMSEEPEEVQPVFHSRRNSKWGAETNLLHQDDLRFLQPTQTQFIVSSNRRRSDPLRQSAELGNSFSTPKSGSRQSPPLASAPHAQNTASSFSQEHQMAILVPAKVGLSNSFLGLEWNDLMAHTAFDLGIQLGRLNAANWNPRTEFGIERSLIQEHTRRKRIEDQWHRLFLSLAEEGERVREAILEEITIAAASEHE